jgi:hypothetical protein
MEASVESQQDVPRHSIVELRLAHLRATAAAGRGWHHVAVQNYLYCMDQIGEAGDPKATAFFAAQLAQSYRAMGMPEKANRFEILR